MVTKRSHILKQTCSWKLQVCLSMCYLLLPPGIRGLINLQLGMAVIKYKLALYKRVCLENMRFIKKYQFIKYIYSDIISCCLKELRNFTQYLCVVIIFYNTGLSKSAFSSCCFLEISFSSFFVLCVFSLLWVFSSVSYLFIFNIFIIFDYISANWLFVMLQHKNTII